jgi:membrane associated rhomboid family serine protease
MAYRTDGYGFGGFTLTPVVKRLLFANAAVYVLTLALPGRFVDEWLAFQPQHWARVWTVFTYMFVHDGFGHLFFNMLALFFFGPPLESRWGGAEFFRYYLICGLGGILLSFLLAPSGIVGASAAIFGLMLAFAMAWPDAPIYIWGIFPVQAKWLMTGLFTLTIFNAFLGGGGGGVAYMAHLGGLMTGFVYLKADWRPRGQLAALKKRSERAARRLAIVPRDEETQAAGAVRSPTWQTADEGQLLDAVDRVLDKISAEGISSLTADERRLLDEVSRRHRSTK